MLNRQELADKLGICLHTLNKYTKAGYIPKAKTALNGKYYISVYTESQYRTARKNLNAVGLYKAVPKGCMTIKMLSERYEVSVSTMATRRSRKIFIEPKGRTLLGEYYDINEFEEWLKEYKKPKIFPRDLILKNEEEINQRIKNGDSLKDIAADYNCSQITIAKYIKARKKVKSKLVNPWETAHQAFNKTIKLV